MSIKIYKTLVLFSLWHSARVSKEREFFVFQELSVEEWCMAKKKKLKDMDQEELVQGFFKACRGIVRLNARKWWNEMTPKKKERWRRNNELQRFHGKRAPSDGH